MGAAAPDLAGPAQEQVKPTGGSKPDFGGLGGKPGYRVWVYAGSQEPVGVRAGSHVVIQSTGVHGMSTRFQASGRC